MEPPMPSLTSVWHNAPYPAISPYRRELSASGKTIIIAGAGTGIGQATALAFARAGAAKIIMIGCKEETLLATQKQFDYITSVHAASVTDDAAITETAAVVMDFLAAENPDVFAAALHPGMVDTANFRASGADASKLPMDSVDLLAEFAVWLTSPEAAFLNGRFAMAN
ncbi:NADP(+)-dependent dehydrogenase [Penicillium odoratum]|uniref:NADP(+)-dependent dehydrogenase n=1 Tax=Penicillium odoratum TaxID=1167516 RepID=UPI002546DCBE|nr:NADP(+)-dependent dehydrogenase [Penicillium odoratum]KAJ5759464.1 NADP(+)-dependent dehydrogenase [Penicillium odoratum]